MSSQAHLRKSCTMWILGEYQWRNEGARVTDMMRVVTFVTSVPLLPPWPFMG